MDQAAPPPRTSPTPVTADAVDVSSAEPLEDASIGVLVTRLTAQTSELVRSEVELAKAELAEKGKAAGIGVGLFSVAGLLAFFGVATLIAAAVLGLAEVVPGWLSALIVAVVILVGAGVAALVGKRNVVRATPPKPEQAIAGLQEDMATVKEGTRE